MARRIHHMGKVMSQGEHDKFHKATADLTSKQHDALMKRLGVTKDEDREWHRTHLTLGEQRVHGLTHVEPSAIGGAFVEWCVKQGWLVRRGKEHFASREGIRELSARFGMVIERARRR